MTKTSVTKIVLLLILFTGIIQYFYPSIIDIIALSPRDISLNPIKYVINIVSHMFVHLSFFHLLANTLFIFFFGSILEERIGSLKYGLVFLTTGIVAGLVFTLLTLMYSLNYGGAGASGAALGVFACLVSLAPEMNVYIMFTKFRITHTLYILTAIYILSLSIESITHITGIIVGSVIGRNLKYKGG